MRAGLATAGVLLAVVGAVAGCGDDGSALDDLTDTTPPTVSLDGTADTTVALGSSPDGDLAVPLLPGTCALVSDEQVEAAVGPVVGEQGLEQETTCTWTAQEGGFLELVAADGTDECEETREAWSLDEATAVSLEDFDGWGVESESNTAVLVCSDDAMIGARIVAPGDNAVEQADLEDLVTVAIENF